MTLHYVTLQHVSNRDVYVHYRLFGKKSLLAHAFLIDCFGGKSPAEILNIMA